MNLVRAEMSRLAARRFVQLMVVLLIAAFGITIATTIASSHQPTTQEIARAEEQAEEQRRRALRWHQECLEAQQRGDTTYPRGRYPTDCRQLGPQQVDREDFLYGVFVFEREIPPLTYFLVAFLALFGFLVGASYIGADLNTGGMTNLLLWRPQRTRVLGAKLATLLGSMAVVSVVAGALYLGAFWAIAKVGGLPGDLDGDFWRWMGLTTARGGALILAVAALGFAVATLGRHTAAALGVVAGYAVVWELGARLVMEIVDADRPEQWVLSTYVGAWMTGEIRLWDRNVVDPGLGLDGAAMYTLTWVHAAVVLGVVIGGLVAGAFANFRRRDLI